MDSCKVSEKDILRIHSVILEMLQSGELQHGLYNCDGVLLGPGAKVLTCCPGCGDAPPPAGPDNDTKNARMTWDAATQKLSLIDTDGKEVVTSYLPRAVEAPLINNGLVATTSIGKDNTVVMAAPPKWFRIVLADGRVGKIPVY